MGTGGERLDVNSRAYWPPPATNGALERAQPLDGRKAVRKRRHQSKLGIIAKRRILYWLAAMVALLVVGTTIGLIWADTSDAAGAIAVVTNIVGALGIALLVVTVG